jgi:hypothetical protein
MGWIQCIEFVSVCATEGEEGEDATRKTFSELHLLRTVALLLSGGEESAFFEAAASV